MTELEIAFVGLIILIGAGAILYAGVAVRKDVTGKNAANGDGGAPVAVRGQFDLDQSGASGGDAGGGGDGGAV